MSEKTRKCPHCNTVMVVKTFFAYNHRFRVLECPKCKYQEFPKQTILNGFSK